MTEKSFYSNGKLLLTAEYLVLDGALALALPTKKGQSLKVLPSTQKGISWLSLDELNEPWLDVRLDSAQIVGRYLEGDINDPEIRLEQILSAAKELNPSFLSRDEELASKPGGIRVETELDFPRNWGLGSSSTLINNIAQWAEIDAYALCAMTFGGSAYDIACAQHDEAITYQLKENKPIVEKQCFNPSYAENLFFVHLNQKQNTRDAVERYRRQPQVELEKNIAQVSEITRKILKASNLSEFELLIMEHELLLSKLLHLPPVKERLFPDYRGTIKSLGGWGGDFVLATGTFKDRAYFKAKGYDTIVTFKEMIL